jgi:hypothetical protein
MLALTNAPAERAVQLAKGSASFREETAPEVSLQHEQKAKKDKFSRKKKKA